MAWWRQRGFLKTDPDGEEEEGDSSRNSNISLATVAVYAVATLATVAVASMELGAPYTASEKRFYTSAAFQTLAVGSVAFTLLNDPRLALLVVFAWALIKHWRRVRRLAA